ncbi:MAG: hypothetical protein M5U26_08540 [Planctomycetota bacterium]|nr:hypothetical protein [Planctomycetota bacterium]
MMLGLRGYRAGRSPLSAHYLQLDPIIEKPADLSVVTWNTQGALTYGAGLTLVFVLPAIDTAPADSVGLGGSFTPSERGLMVYNWSVPEAMWGFRLRLDSDESYGSNSEEAGFDFDGNLSDVRVFGA